VRYGECDQQGVVFNANYLGFVDVVMTEFWREAIGNWDDMLAEGLDMVVAESRLRFRAPARFDDILEFELRIERLGTTAMTFAIDMRRDDGTLLVEAETRHVLVRAGTQEKTEIPAHIREALEPYAAGAEAAA
jgi:acyl-CoA thioester hydrolase